MGQRDFAAALARFLAQDAPHKAGYPLAIFKYRNPLLSYLFFSCPLHQPPGS